MRSSIGPSSHSQYHSPSYFLHLYIHCSSSCGIFRYWNAIADEIFRATLEQMSYLHQVTIAEEAGKPANAYKPTFVRIDWWVWETWNDKCWDWIQLSTCSVDGGTSSIPSKTPGRAFLRYLLFAGFFAVDDGQLQCISRESSMTTIGKLRTDREWLNRIGSMRSWRKAIQRQVGFESFTQSA